MRIGIFTDSYPPYINGVSTSVKMLEDALKKRGHQVYIVTVNPDNLKYRYEDDSHIIRIPGIPVHIYDYRLTNAYPIKAMRKIKKWNLDVIHSQTEFGIGTFARIVSKQYDIPLIHTYHTMYEDYTHYITHGHFNKASKKIVKYLTDFYCDQTATELIVPTKKTYDLFKSKYKYARDVHIIPTGIDIERFYKENFKKKDIEVLRNFYGIKKDEKVILFVGRIASEKNIELLIDAHKEIIKKCKCKLMIIGDGPDIEKYKKQVSKNKLDDYVVFTGRIIYRDIPKYYQIANIFATASTSETQGLTVIEASAASLPVVCVNDESFNTVIIDGINGYLFNNKKEYIKKTIDLLNDDNLLEQFSNQARISSNNYSSSTFASEVEKVYKKAIEKTNSNNKNIFNGFIGVVKKMFKKS